MNIFRHKHDFKFENFVHHTSKVVPWSASPCTAKVYKCKCGEIRRELTSAGYQQLDWGDNIDELLGVK